MPNPVLLAQVIDNVQLMLVYPPGDGDQHEPERIHHSHIEVRLINGAGHFGHDRSKLSFLLAYTTARSSETRLPG